MKLTFELSVTVELEYTPEPDVRVGVHSAIADTTDSVQDLITDSIFEKTGQSTSVSVQASAPAEEGE